MITIPTHKCDKSPFKHSKTIYVFTSRRVIVIVQIHSKKKILKGLKWPLQNGHQYRSIVGFTYRIQWNGGNFVYIKINKDENPSTKSTRHVKANVNTQKQNQDNQNNSNAMEDIMLKGHPLPQIN